MPGFLGIPLGQRPLNGLGKELPARHCRNPTRVPDGRSCLQKPGHQPTDQGDVTHPLVRKLVMSWVFFSVLSTLTKPPYQTIDCSTLLQLSVKMPFLLAVATSRRRSELHSLSVEAGNIWWEPGGVRLVPLTSFQTFSSWTLSPFHQRQRISCGPGTQVVHELYEIASYGSCFI